MSEQELEERVVKVERKVAALSKSVETLVSVIDDLIYASDNEISYCDVQLREMGHQMTNTKACARKFWMGWLSQPMIG